MIIKFFMVYLTLPMWSIVVVPEVDDLDILCVAVPSTEHRVPHGAWHMVLNIATHRPGVLPEHGLLPHGVVRVR